MKDKYNKPLCVNVTTQAEWDFVSEKKGYKWLIGKFNTHKDESCIDLYKQHFGNINYCKNNNFTVLSFSEYCNRMGFNNPFKKKMRVRVFTKSCIDNKRQEHLHDKWFNDFSNKLNGNPSNIFNDSKQINYFYNYRDE